MADQQPGRPREDRRRERTRSLDVLDDRFHRQAVEGFHDGVYYVDRGRRIMYWNSGAQRLTGYAPDEVVGQRCYANILNHVDAAGNVLCLGRCPLAATIRDGEPREAEVFLRHQEGHRVPVRVRVAPIRDDDGVIVGAVEVFNNATDLVLARREAEEQRTLAQRDDLTGLPNRRYGDLALAGRERDAEASGRTYGVFLADLDGFKGINDRHGHAVGDAVLRTVARTMAASLRTNDEVVRWGGDEFLGIADAADGADLLGAAERLRVLVARSRTHAGGRDHRVTVTVGAATARPGEPAAVVVERADRALLEAKAAGRNRVLLAADERPGPEG